MMAEVNTLQCYKFMGNTLNGVQEHTLNSPEISYCFQMISPFDLNYTYKFCVRNEWPYSIQRLLTFCMPWSLHNCTCTSTCYILFVKFVSICFVHVSTSA